MGSFKKEPFQPLTHMADRELVQLVCAFRLMFPDVGLVVFGHSHIPLDAASDDGGFRIFNPGSPTDRRRQPHRLEICGKQEKDRHYSQQETDPQRGDRLL